MIITEQFVMLAFPKTGSSFIRRNLKQIHNYNSLPRRILRRLGMEVHSSMAELLLPVISEEVSPHTESRHALYTQVPEEYRGKPIVSSIRNPFDRYVSAYLFGRWKTSYPMISQDVFETFPAFPELTFEEYYRMVHQYGRKNRLQGIEPKIDLGIYTIQFIQFHFKDPKRVLSEIDTDYIEQGAYQEDMPDITFLHQEDLNQELYEFLLSCGYRQKKVQYLINAERVNVTPRSPEQQRYHRFYNQELIDLILERDKLLFKMFPDYASAIDTERSEHHIAGSQVIHE